MINEFKLSELLNARFCHDLAGPIGAISNGVEFLGNENEEIKNKALHILELGSEQALLRLQFYRQIYGYNKPGTGAAIDQVKEVITNYLVSNKIPFSWNFEAEPAENEINAQQAKIIANIINIAGLAVIKKGKIDCIVTTKTNDLVVTIKVSGELIKFDQESQTILTTGGIDEELSTKNIHLYYSYRLIKTSQTTLNINAQDNELTFDLIFKK
jgi:histidine phosphotransferase ChpT